MLSFLRNRKVTMQFIFDDSIQQAKDEFLKCISDKHLAKIDYIKQVVDMVGFNNVKEDLIKHLWNDVYEFRPHDGRVIFVRIDGDNAYVLGAYIKKSNKMPKNIQNTLKQREKILKNTM